MRDKIGITLGLLISILVLLTLAVYIMNAVILEFTDLVSIAIVIILVLLASYTIWDRARNVRKGLPAKDERLINISYKAGYYAFVAAIFSPLIGQFMADIILGSELEGHHVTAIVVLVSGLVFVTSYLYLARKGN